MFPLNTVLFPGVTVPLRVFEDRYRALVHRLLRIDDPAERLFGSVAIREGYEVGERGGQSVHRIGCLLQLTEVEKHDDGTFDIVAVGRSRLRLEGMDASGPVPVRHHRRDPTRPTTTSTRPWPTRPAAPSRPTARRCR